MAGINTRSEVEQIVATLEGEELAMFLNLGGRSRGRMDVTAHQVRALRREAIARERFARPDWTREELADMARLDEGMREERAGARRIA